MNTYFLQCYIPCLFTLLFLLWDLPLHLCSSSFSQSKKKASPMLLSAAGNCNIFSRSLSDIFFSRPLLYFLTINPKLRPSRFWSVPCNIVFFSLSSSLQPVCYFLSQSLRCDCFPQFHHLFNSMSISLTWKRLTEDCFLCSRVIWGVSVCPPASFPFSLLFVWSVYEKKLCLTETLPPTDLQLYTNNQTAFGWNFSPQWSAHLPTGGAIS